MGISCGLNLHLDASATRCLVNRRGLGKAKHVDMQNLRLEVSKAGRTRHEEGRHERESRRPDDKAAGKAEDRAAHERHGLRVLED